MPSIFSLYQDSMGPTVFRRAFLALIRDYLLSLLTNRFLHALRLVEMTSRALRLAEMTEYG